MRWVATLLAAWAAAMALGVSGAPAAGPPGAAAPGRGVRDVVGVTHVAGTYCRTDKDFLAEGADEVLALGSRVIKLYLHKPRTNYPFHTEWPEAASLADLARLPPYAAVFAKPFTTYILTAYALGRPDHYWKDGGNPLCDFLRHIGIHVSRKQSPPLEQVV